ncbi:MAG: ABC transporter ATP-binding protein [Magnetococcales bacterium]|nr:ABC transporter ATP-binding protein [Magnetococcales bacterium]
MTPLLTVEGLRLGCGGRDFCRDLVWSIRPGERWAILGPNGAGKSTLLHALAGLRGPDAGEIRLAGQPLPRISRRAVAREIGILFQQIDYTFPSTVLATVLGGRYPHRAFWSQESGEDLDLARRALRLTGLEGLEERPVSTLSGGERRRMEAATLLVQDPRVLLLDEPTNHLDLNHQIALLELFTERVRVTAGAMVLVTHDIHMAARYCDRFLLVHGNGTWDQGGGEAMLTPERLSRLLDHPMRMVNADGERFWLPA